MRKALATFGTGPAADLLRTTFPTFHEYALRHDYDLVVGTGEADGRPWAWGKVRLLRRLLDTYDSVLWVDADAIILDDSVDIFDVIPPTAWQAFSVLEGNGGDGNVPCTGVWAFRSTDTAREFLDLVWAQDDLINHSWWEQTAVMRLMGWSIEHPLQKIAASEWEGGTHYLTSEWDAIPLLPGGYGPTRIRHFAAMSQRRRLFDINTDLAGRRLAQSESLGGLAPGLRHAVGKLQRRIDRGMHAIAQARARNDGR